MNLFGYTKTRLHVNLGFACNHHCRYCVQNHVAKPVLSKKVSPNAIAFIEKQASQIFPETLKITFFGGEPLLYFGQMKEIVESVQAKNIQWKLHTNGSRLTDEIVQFFNLHDFHVGISHDGPLVKQTRLVDIFDDARIGRLISTIDRKYIDVVITAYSQNLYAVHDWFSRRIHGHWILKPAFLSNSDKVPSDLIQFDFSAWEATVERVVNRACESIESGVDGWEAIWLKRLLTDAKSCNPYGDYFRAHERCLVPHVDLSGNVTFCEGLEEHTRSISFIPYQRAKWIKIFNDISDARHPPCKNCSAFRVCRGQCPKAVIQTANNQCRLMQIFVDTLGLNTI